MADYRQVTDALTGQPSTRVIQRMSDSAFIPFDPDNRDYAAYLAWLGKDNTPDPPPPFEAMT